MLFHLTAEKHLLYQFRLRYSRICVEKGR